VRALQFCAFVAGIGAIVGACSGSGASDEAVSGAQGIDEDRRRHRDSGTEGGDGTPSRQPCTSSFGDAIRGAYGRLDGFIASVVPPARGGECAADRHHVHVQVAANGQTFDVAINTNSGFMAKKDAPLPAGPWSEGWHRDVTLDYVSDLGLHDGDFAAVSAAELDQQIEAALANANHVSVFATPYSHGGVHLVHRHLNHDDGALVLDPLAPNAHVFAFKFSDQAF
jgi:hypothetical protein